MTQIIFDNHFVEFVRNHDYRKGPIIFVPTHRSYVDFLIVSYLLAHRDAQPPFIGAADNMNNIFVVNPSSARSAGSSNSLEPSTSKERAINSPRSTEHC